MSRAVDIGIGIAIGAVFVALAMHAPEIQARVCIARGLDAVITGSRTTCVGFPYEGDGQNTLWKRR